MKKYYSLVLLAVLLFSIGFIAINIKNAKPIPLLEKFYFGISPKIVERQLGKPVDVKIEPGGSDKMVYSYDAIVLDEQAAVACFFQNDRKLTEVHLQWNNNSTELYERIYACLFARFNNHKDFFIKKADDKSKTVIGIDNGISGLFFSIYLETDCIRVICVDNS